MDEIELTGTGTEVEIEVEAPAERMWDLVTDVERIGEWSPEVTGGAWLPGGGPRPGARFRGRNRWPGGEVTCVVTEAERPGLFAWVVLDAAGDPRRPGSIWRYELAAGRRPGTTRVRNRFTHGPGQTGLTRIVEEDPEHGREHLENRLQQLRSNMVRTVEAMARSAARPTTAPRAPRDGDESMKYLLLICWDPTVQDTGGPGIETWLEEMETRRIRLDGQRLRPISDATTVRRRDGELLVTDGPFAETKEQIAGYDIIEAADLDEAIEVASKHPMTRVGSVEVRPFWPME